MIFHAGTRQDADTGQTVTSGGRVLCVTALGDSVAAAQRSAYEQVNKLCFDGLQYRSDIGFRAIEPANETTN